MDGRFYWTVTQILGGIQGDRHGLSEVAEALMDNNVLVSLKRLGVPDLLVDHATPDQSKASLGLTPAQMAEEIRASLFEKDQVPAQVAW